MRKTNKLRFAAVLLLAGACIAQVPKPPTCTGPGAKPSIAVASVASRSNAEKALAIEAAGAADPLALVSSVPVENLEIARDRIADYADCVGSGGCYWADVDAQSARAERELERLVATKKSGQKLAIIFDVDETSLSSYCEMKREDYGYIDTMFNAWVLSPEANIPIPGTLRLFHRARAAGVTVFFITGRPEDQRSATERNLHSAGFDGWERLSLRTVAQKTTKTQTYKSAERQKIVDAGYRIVMNIGDQWSDLNGMPRAELNVKLPNPFYFLP